MGLLNTLNTVFLFACLAAGCGQAPSASDIDATNTANAGATPETVTPVTPEATSTPVAEASPAPSPTPTSAPAVVESFTFNNSVGICNALDTWNPTTTTIRFPTNSGSNPTSTFLYSFEATGVYVRHLDGTLIGIVDAVNEGVTIQKFNSGPTPVCTITVQHGVFVSVQ